MTSMRVRLFAILALVTAMVWGGSAVWIQVKTQAEIQQVLDRRLMESARMVSSLLDQGDLAAGAEAVGAGLATPVPADGGYERQLSCQIWSLRGELVSRSEGAPAERLAQTDGFSERTLRGEPWRVYTVHNEAVGVQVMVGDRLAVRDRLVSSIITSLIAPTLLGLVALGLLIWWSVGRGLAPAQRLADALRARGPDDLTPVQTPGSVRELVPMVTALNDLIDRLDVARRRQAEFTAAAAHELRTPLAGLRVQAQVATSATDPAVRSKALHQMLASVDRTSALVGRMLDMARVDGIADAPPSRRWIPLSDLIQRDGAGCHVTLELTEAASALQLNVDRERIAALFGNLVANACAHARYRVVIDVQANAGMPPFLTVDDDGPGVHDNDLPKLGRRFYRGRGALPGGAGLGLSIAQAAAANHGWRLTYARSPLGGLRVEIGCPSADIQLGAAKGIGPKNGRTEAQGAWLSVLLSADRG